MNEGVKVDLSRILEKVIEKASQDNIISEDESDLIDTIKISIEDYQAQIENILENESEKMLLQKVLASTSEQILKDIVSQARTDGKISFEEQEIITTLFSELGFHLRNYRSRLWFVFKICVNIDYETDVDVLLDYFDKVFCLRGIDATKVYSGLCLGTKHYVIEDIDVTLLAFAVTPDTTQDWVTKGAFATVDFTDASFGRDLEVVANDLIVDNYLSKNLS